MNPAQALHTAAIRYCDEHYSYWTREYAKLPNQGRQRNGSSYTSKALETFPRYTVLKAIRIELQRLEPAELPDVEDTRAVLLEAGMLADDLFTEGAKGEKETRAMEQERAKFCRYVEQLTEDELSAISPLPYKRVLSSSESETCWTRLRTRWNIQGEYWFPLADRTGCDIEAFQDHYFYEACPVRYFRRLLADRGINKIWELRESGPEYIMDTSILNPVYNGAEGYFFSEEPDWIIYVSHESSVTVGGWFLHDVKKVWPEWASHVWISPFF